MKLAHFVILSLLFLSSCAHQDDSHDLSVFIRGVSEKIDFKVVSISSKIVGWNDSFKTGVIISSNPEELYQRSVRMGPKDYIPFEGSLLTRLLKENPSAELYFLQSTSGRERRFYFIVDENRITFDLLTF